ncbi:MAG: type II toxin-antitoxin system RelE/ParE family toxin [Peptococcaceae bacterium]|jgi:addiction module RelE/StbE family toxin|nr:type II toxin-antitoxin system RelE/ParE family toxin [Peptococcaceae bacterium]
MSSKYKVKFTPLANNDMDGMYEYIFDTLSAPMAAENLIEEIEKKIKRLADMPSSCPAVDDELLQAKGYRKLVVKNYIALYMVSDAEKLVTIMRVVYGMSDYEKNI